MKKLFSLAVIFISFTILLTGCGSSVSKATEKANIVPETYAMQQSTNIMDNIKNKNSSALKSMFCDKVKSSGSLDSDITNAFTFIEGNIVGSGTPTGSLDNKETSGDDVISLSIRGSASNISTDSGKTYTMEFKEYYAYANDEGYEGVTYISITDTENNMTVYIGDTGL